MSTPLDDALAQLGLRPDADARSVRRAYAQQLKRIDQATQPREFQSLREAYELALHAITRQEAERAAPAQDAEPTSPPAEVDRPAAPAAAPAPTVIPPQDSADLARAVFGAFAERASAAFRDEEDAATALRDALADDRLLNLEARTLFELQVAHLLMSGWQPGHEFLFDAACEAFHWERDRRHLRVFGDLGAALDAAINEKLIFFQQTPDLQLNVIRRLREREMPSVALRQADLPLVQVMVQRYPNWLRLVTSQANINNWFRELPERVATVATRGEVPAQPLAAHERGWKPAPTLTPWFLVLMAVFMLGKLFSASPPSYAPRPDLGRPLATAPSGPPIATWPPPGVSVLPGEPSFSGDTSRPHKPLYDPPPSANDSPSRAYDPGAQLVFLGNVTFSRRAGQVTVDDVDERSRRGSSSLKRGDRLEDCPDLDSRIPFVFFIETSRCGTEKSIDQKTGAVSYTFRVLRNGKSLMASLTMPPSPAAAQQSPSLEVTTPTAATAAADSHPSTKVRHLEVDETAQIGHVTFIGSSGGVVEVAKLGKPTHLSDSTLRPWDRVLRCLSGAHAYKPINLPAETKRCAVANDGHAEPGITTYMFRVARNSQVVTASLTLRDAPNDAASSTATPLRSDTSN
ncbi:hypothetical protein ACG04Q_01920 [Roseateles sp. DXS20W]|uniref:J domain-containing protein n=1 Tax=Pelomonas lactea TaxID=3299030 RepID=A0ABW7GEE1_9BURK